MFETEFSHTVFFVWLGFSKPREQHIAVCCYNCALIRENGMAGYNHIRRFKAIGLWRSGGISCCHEAAHLAHGDPLWGDRLQPRKNPPLEDRKSGPSEP